MEVAAEIFGGLVGQTAAKRWLLACLGSGNLPQALIFAGPQGVGRKTAAKLVARWLHGENRFRTKSGMTKNTEDDVLDSSTSLRMTKGKMDSRLRGNDENRSGNDENRSGNDENRGGNDENRSGHDTMIHPDTFWFSQVWREMKEHGSDEEKKSPWMHTAHAMIRFLEMSPLSSKYKVAIVDDGEKLTEDAQNALLKTFEEPKGDSVIIFIVPSEEALLPTIVSRAQVVRFGPLSEEEIKQIVPEASVEQIKASGGSAGLVKNWAEMPAEWERAREVREFWQSLADHRQGRGPVTAPSGIPPQAVTESGGVTTKFQWAMRFKERDEAVDFIRTGIQVWREMLPDERVARGLERMQTAVQQIRDNVNLRAALDTLLLAL